VTFLFTDIEGSTRRWEDDADAMAKALARHDSIVRAAIDAHDGTVFATGGDGFAVAFARAADALECAADAQRALQAEDFVAVRIGLHTGEAVERDGDYFGPTVNRAARLMAIAHGGQTLVSGATASIVTGFELADLGEHRLRDLSRPERVFQLRADGLRAEFPALRSLDTIPTNLPVELTSFVGRVTELAEVAKAMRERRLVTITGVGGVGKTRLALQIAAELAVEHPDGAWLCELAGAQDGEALLEIVAVALGVAPRAGLSRAESIIEQLRTKQLVLVLDNCEHLVDESAELAERILRDCAGVRLLATSREGLGIPGEQLWPLRSLPAPAAGASTDELLHADAVTLFSDRALSADPHFTIDDRTAPAVAEICRRLDGIPLAIELAAARTAAISPPEIAALLDERFRLLTGGRRRAVERHQTLRAAVDWSYSLLEPAERTVFERLGLFVGSFDESAARGVVADTELDRFAVLDALEELVAKSMLTTEYVEDGTRYQLLETLRQFALDRLEASSDVDQLRRRHAVHYADLAAALGPQLRNEREVAARRRVFLELDNVRSAIGWALERAERADQLLAVRMIAYFATLVSTARSTAFGDWAERAATAAEHAPDEIRFTALGAAAFAATTRGDIATAAALSEVAFARGVPDDAPEYSMTFISRAIVLMGTDSTAASDMIAAHVDRVAELGDPYGAVTMRAVIGMFSFLGGDVARGQREAARAAQGARALGNPTALTVALMGDAMVRWQDDPRTALVELEECLALVAAGASDVVYADALELRARVESGLGDVRGALETMRAGLAESISVGNRPSVLSSQWYLAEILGLARRDLEVAATLHGFTARGPLSSSFPAIGGNEAQIHDRAVAAAREELGPQRFDELTELGARMSYEAAVEYTTAALDELLTEGDA
jgi:predicted ATPase